ncbi:MAG: DUF2892 domain-containing protein [Parcubacteria group bacterium]|jgi:hypothetical protein
MQKNEGTWDRAIRAILGVVIVFFAYASFSGIIALLVYAVGLALIFTAVTGYCYLYKILGINTSND